MNILHVIDSGGLYGAEVVLLNLMEAQRDCGMRPCLLSLGSPYVDFKIIETEAQKKSLNVVTARFKNGPNVFGALQILKIASSLGTDIIHSHGYKGNILLGFLPKRLRNIPVVTTIHGWTATRTISRLKLYEIIDILSMRRLDGVVAVSANILLKNLVNYFGIHPVVINNGIKPLKFGKGAFRHNCPQIALKCENKYKILSIGRLSKEKGFDILIRAVASLVKDNVAITLVIIGEGEERTHLEQNIKELKLTEIVHLIGYRQQAHNYMVDFDAFVLPSLTEGLPITILEAMQAGVPIIATRVGENPVLLDEGELGELIKPNDKENLISALKRIYANRESAIEKASRAKQIVLNRYGIDGMAMQYEILYRKILETKNGP